MPCVGVETIDALRANRPIAPHARFKRRRPSVSPGGLNKVISNYNAKNANQATPAGQVLMQNGLMTLPQLQGLGGVTPTLQLAPPNNVGLGWLKTFDLKVSWQYHIKEAATIEPSFGVFNLFNFANFDLPPNVLSPYLTGTPGNIGGTNYAGTQNVRVGDGTGVYGLGAPRVAECTLKVTF